MDKPNEKVLALLDDYGERLFALLTRLTLREDVAGDLMQELFLKLSNNNRFDQNDHPYTYAYRAAMNLAFSWWRQQRLKFETLKEDQVAAPQDFNPLKKIIRNEQLEQILDAITRLNELPREVLVLRFIEQESYDQISKRLGKKPQHLRSICSKALTQLREILNQNPNTPQPKEKYNVKH